jgi:nucleotide-binding universal stress UspA family protein
MPCKSIAVHLDSGARCAARVDLAIGLAQRFDGRLVGIAPTGLPDVTIPLNTPIPDVLSLAALSAHAMREQARAAASAFELQCRNAGLTRVESQLAVEPAVDAMVLGGRCSDLVVVGQTDTSNFVDGVPFDLPQQVLLHAGAPVLVVPYVGKFTAPGRKVLVAWKNTQEAARALRAALPLLDGALEVTLAEFGEERGDERDEPTDDAVAAWLASHGLPVRRRRDPSRDAVGDRLLTLAAELECDLIVAGGYGHSRLREWTLGGVTRHLLERMTAPTLMSH